LQLWLNRRSHKPYGSHCGRLNRAAARRAHPIKPAHRPRPPDCGPVAWPDTAPHPPGR
jgi:hypothetical protein